MAAPRKLTPTVEKKILNAIRRGHYQKDAAFLADIGESTLRYWLQLGRADKTKSTTYYKFWIKFEKALIEAQAGQVRDIRRGETTVKIIKDRTGKKIRQEISRKRKTGDIRWLLAKRFPERYGDGLAGMLESFRDRYGEEFAGLLSDLIEAAESELDAAVEYDEPELQDND